MVHLQMLYSQLEDQQIAPPTYMKNIVSEQDRPKERERELWKIYLQ